MIGREFVQEDDRRSPPGLFEIQTHIVASHGVGHLAISSHGPGANIVLDGSRLQ
jgi:hypothetical protein